MTSAFLQPHNIEELKPALGAMTKESLILAGGTDLMPMIRSRRPKTDLIVSIGHVKELKGIEERDGWVRIGALTTHDELSKAPVILEKFTALSDSCSKVGSQQIRNKGTIGGSLVNASPAGDMIPCVCLFHGELETLDAKGNTRRIPAEEFTLGSAKTALAPGELLTYIWLPVREGRRSAFVKLGSRKEVTIAQISMAVSWKPGAPFAEVEGYLGAVDVKPMPLEEINEILGGKPVGKEEREALTASLRERIEKIRKNRTRPPKLKITEAEQLYKERAVRSVVYDMVDKMEERI